MWVAYKFTSYQYFCLHIASGNLISEQPYLYQRYGMNMQDYVGLFQVQEVGGAHRKGVQQNSEREVQMGNRHGNCRLQILTLVLTRELN